jgi:hypothetical protein
MTNPPLIRQTDQEDEQLALSFDITGCEGIAWPHFHTNPCLLKDFDV